VGGPVLSLVVGYDNKVVFQKLLKKQGMVSMTVPSFKYYFVEQNLKEPVNTIILLVFCMFFVPYFSKIFISTSLLVLF
jgi:hypothetical protein